MSDLVEIISRDRDGALLASVTAKLGTHIRINSAALAKYCLKDIAPICEDVATVAEAVAFSDRFMTRRRSQRWARRLLLKVPVFEIDVFEREKTRRLLMDTLCFLTGDDWEFTFVRRTRLTQSQQYLPLTAEQPRYVVPFSNGLDSYAQAKLLETEHGTAAVLTVRAGKVSDGDSRITVPAVEISRRFQAGHPREKSYRTRPFVYFCFAAIAAVTSRAESIIIGENGQGSLGPSFAKFGNEWPFRSTHPGYVARLQSLLSEVFAKPVRFEQPQLWRTKGQVLADLKQRNLIDKLQQTRSCSLRPLQRLGFHGCGYCGGCMLRRVSFLAAGIEPEEFAFNISASELAVASGNIAENLPKTQKDILVRSALSMSAFSEVPVQEDSHSILSREVRDIPTSSDELAHTPEAIGVRLKSLADQHRSEWRSMLASLPENAWLRTHFY